MSPHPPDETRAPTLLAVTWTLYIFVSAVFGLRIYARSRPTTVLGWDDIAMTVAFLALSIQMGLLIPRVNYGLGHHNYYIPPENRKEAMRLLFITQLLWIWAIAMCKISVAFMFLRIKREKRWLIFLYLSILLQVATAIASNVAQFVRCQPVAAQWDPTIAGAKCWGLTGTQANVYVNSAIVIVTDFIFSCLPITFIRKINRPMREKIVLCILMRLSLVATSASIAKTMCIKNFGKTGDTLWVGIDIAILSFVELQLGIIAASVPCLKSIIERSLNHLGLISSIPNTTSHAETDYMTHHSLKRLKMGSLRRISQIYTRQERVGDGPSEENILPLELTELGEGKSVRTTEIRKEGELKD
ncbi:hypothetical protein K469DRAFT_588865 [Zopfia rhizophila CBS 207.26]|uniref:Rhodopsin domain-containing protein n=1 Tax=Zopfia rhizophila CBS 207.26 TaxID=1314779 RepID=A0A6A6DT18_9PEZI|nr:hypothetical protein K469DRAFT_588865 [Zopfia rhizophila CBS 207.26]